MSGHFKPLPGAQLDLSHPLARGLVASYLFNEGSGNLVHDYSEQGNHGTIVGMNDPPIATSGWNAGPHGGALAFDGAGDKITCSDNASLNFGTMDFTLTMWLRTAGVGSEKGILCKRTGITGYQIYLQGGVNAYFFIGDGVVYEASGFAINDNLWHFVVFTFNRDGNAFGYKDGKLITSRDISAVGDITNTKVLEIGNELLANLYFPGYISNASIYNRALSAEEIAYLYAFPYCMFDDGTDWRSRLVPYIPVRDLDRTIAAQTIRAVNSGRVRGVTAPARVTGV